MINIVVNIKFPGGVTIDVLTLNKRYQQLGRFVNTPCSVMSSDT